MFGRNISLCVSKTERWWESGRKVLWRLNKCRNFYVCLGGGLSAKWLPIFKGSHRHPPGERRTYTGTPRGTAHTQAPRLRAHIGSHGTQGDHWAPWDGSFTVFETPWQEEGRSNWNVRDLVCCCYYTKKWHLKNLNLLGRYRSKYIAMNDFIVQR